MIEIFTQYIPNFLLILLRVGVFFTLLPFYGSKNLPAQFKIGLIIAITLILTPVIEMNIAKNDIPILVVREVLFGIILGLTARLIFFAVEMAGQIMSNAMGMSIASSFNPDMGQSTEIARLYGMITMLIFLAVDAHHDLIFIFVRSYEWIPSGQFEIRNLIPKIISDGSRLFLISLKLSAPVVIVMLITNLLLGFLYRAAPQMNIFFIGYPIYIFVGLLVMLICIPVFINVLGGHIGTIKDDMLKAIAIGRV